MPTKLPATDIVIIGLAWTGSIVAESMTTAGFNVIAIERGPWRDTASDFPPTYARDELRYSLRYDPMVRPEQTTLTFRNRPNQTALPMRSLGSFLPGNGAGGAGVHWNSQTRRFLPTDFVLKTHLVQRYGATFLPPDMTIQDWGVSYDELEPHYDRFEYLYGTSGIAGNLKGRKQPFGNPFEGPRSRRYPTPAQKQPYGPVLWAERRRRWATVHSRRLLATSRRPIPIRSASPLAPAPIAASASASDAATIHRRARRRRFYPC
jgi:gluconate 2-dehydrogenase alpha chain